jgi:hypothetical protein
MSKRDNRENVLPNRTIYFFDIQSRGREINLQPKVVSRPSIQIGTFTGCELHNRHGKQAVLSVLQFICKDLSSPDFLISFNTP